MRLQAAFLRESIARIDRIDPQAGALDELQARRTRIEHAARVNAGVAQALGERDAPPNGALRAAKRLTKARRTAADALCQAVAGELGQLAMDGAALSIRVQPRSGDGALDAHGADDIAFLFTPFPGAAVAGELGQLAMDGAALSIRVQPRSGDGALDAHGADDIAFLFTPFPGAEPMPMGASASGGELSRLMRRCRWARARRAAN